MRFWRLAKSALSAIEEWRAESQANNQHYLEWNRLSILHLELYNPVLTFARFNEHFWIASSPYNRYHSHCYRDLPTAPCLFLTTNATSIFEPNKFTIIEAPRVVSGRSAPEVIIIHLAKSSPIWMWIDWIQVNTTWIPLLEVPAFKKYLLTTTLMHSKIVIGHQQSDSSIWSCTVLTISISPLWRSENWEITGTYKSHRILSESAGLVRCWYCWFWRPAHTMSFLCKTCNDLADLSLFEQPKLDKNQ